MPYTENAMRSHSCKGFLRLTLNSIKESDVPPPFALGTGTKNCKLRSPPSSIRKDVFVEL
ncbi:hypothetical protein PAXRUDRAFT_666403 [Paxillus rubicundulus Ve08.2h10]|uniref:Uncharacterized protein n=1 Tax=Paxillus rubicundulus Ve08.2h10 TaxID=930991 RepID=A0A0D0DIC2_9AGAM|nr:hypothetical protein PAXRUDRAFT_666403 [Paxillus rubicundulus Ve08.2h10]